MKTKRYISGAMLAVTILLVAAWVRVPGTVYADDTNFSDGITVDSTLDTPDDNVGDNICDDGDGNCTLRAAIQEANATAGTQTIKFNVTGTPDFINGGQNGYTIQPDNALPTITGQVTIDGFSQPGAVANTTVAPAAFNSRLLIEVDGTNAGTSSGFNIDPSASNVVFNGLVVNSFESNGFAGNGGGAGTVIHGCYIGTDPTGLIAKGNGSVGVQVGANAELGGLDPSDRNIISSNDEGGASPNTGDDNWVVQGNYFGLGADGTTLLPGSQPGGSGALSLDNSDGHTIGGSQTGAVNVIASNRGHAIAPHNSDNLLIEGNYIGLKADGTTAGFFGTSGFGGSGGIALSESNNATIRNNKISNGVVGTGIVFNLVTGGVIQSNLITNNFGGGITLAASTGVLIGGTQSAEANVITQNLTAGVVNLTLYITNFSAGIKAVNNTIIGNAIYDNQPGELFGFPIEGLGIDLMEATLTNGVPQSTTNNGVTLNSVADSTSASNGYINFPVLHSVKQTGTSLKVTYDLDSEGSPSDEYRVEFFANDTADPSGHGEGQTFLGSVTASNGNGNTATLTLPSGTDLTGKVLSATTTAVDNTTDSGFGSTSEFSAVLGVEVVASVNNPTDADTNVNLAQTGQNTRAPLLFGAALITASAATMIAKRKYVYKARP